ncbi:uncharacterized protein LOC117522034 isoform X2 [Thalassophryne amazonica]|uniref:uncharacterized protein LOC117522034 isoform X2 n=1 Tax=Thalassophryne amazonica TaxID=390379 RepID=UPI001470939F|nr:uncharacterized protein LOC117522034 isoform X2 [Thalassophryne amazonica]
MLLFVLVLLCHLSQGVPDTVEAVILQVQRWGVVGTQQVVDRVLLNGVPLTGSSQEVNNIVQTMSASAVLPTFSVGQNPEQRNYTVLRLRECIMEGSELHWTDRVFYDGKVYLTLNQSDTWTANVPQALSLKALWDKEVQRTSRERILLQEGCTKLMRELKLSQEPSGIPVNQFLIPVLALMALVGIIIITLFISESQGLRHPGGVIGSVIHYPKDMSEMQAERKGCVYQTL